MLVVLAIIAFSAKWRTCMRTSSESNIGHCAFYETSSLIPFAYYFYVRIACLVVWSEQQTIFRFLKIALEKKLCRFYIKSLSYLLFFENYALTSLSIYSERSDIFLLRLLRKKHYSIIWSNNLLCSNLYRFFFAVIFPLLQILVEIPPLLFFTVVS